MTKYSNKNILITGGTGFIGSRLAERLVVEENANVSVLVNSWAKATWVSRLNVNLIQGNILDEEKLMEICKGIDIVFHCVGIGGTLEECMQINVAGTQKVLEASLKNKVKRVVYFSSVVVSGPKIDEGLNEEDAFKKTGNSYADSKIEAEKLFLEFIKNNDIEGTVIRPTFVWGPISPYYTIDIIQQIKSKSFQVVDEGSGSCNAVYIDNLVDLALVCGLHPKANLEVFLVRDAENISWKQFYAYYAAMLQIDISSFISIPSKSNFIRKSTLNFKSVLDKFRLKLTNKVNSYTEKNALLTKIFFKAPRKILKLMIKTIEKKYPEMDSWDLETYSSKGFIDISKAQKLLEFTPKVSIVDGMKACEKSLKLQNYLN